MSTELSNADLLRILENNKRLVALGDQKAVLNFLLDEAVKLAGAERGFIIFFTQDGFHVASARHFDGAELKKAQKKFSSTILKKMREAGKALVMVDAEKDSRVKKAESVLELALRSVLCVPVGLGGEWYGALYLENRFQEGAFSDDTAQTVSLFADQAALSLQALKNLEAAEIHAAEMETLQRQLARLNENLHEEVEQTRRERDQIRALLEPGKEPMPLPGVVGRSKALRQTVKVIRQLQEAVPSVFIHGESGTGKELMARALHQNSPRAAGPFLAINCAAFSEPVLDSELFGHVRGAFTGADRDRRGLFAAADGGTLFLDEVGEMSPGMQAKLLRVLQEGEIRPLGSNQTQKVSVRILAASNRDLKKMVEEKSFREDLFYRLNVVRMDLPPLRERREDISDLVQYFMRHNSQGIPESLLAVDETVLDCLMQYDWPGNIRELQNEVERALILGKGHLRVKNLSPHLQAKQGAGPAITGGGLQAQLGQLERNLLMQALEAAKGNKKAAADHLAITRTKLYQLIKKHRLGQEYGQITPGKIRQTLRKTQGNKSLAAQRLGISRRTLYEILNRG